MRVVVYLVRRAWHASEAEVVMRQNSCVERRVSHLKIRLVIFYLQGSECMGPFGYLLRDDSRFRSIDF